MKIKRKIVTSTNKTSGYRIGNLFNSLNYLVVYVRFKGEDIGKTQLIYFSQDFNKLSESEHLVMLMEYHSLSLKKTVFIIGIKKV